MWPLLLVKFHVSQGYVVFLFFFEIQKNRKTVMPLLLRYVAVTTREISRFTPVATFWARSAGVCGAMANPNGGALPKPGEFVTPQARDEITVTIEEFFDPARYHGRTVGLPPLLPPEPMTDLTPENIQRFFDQSTYHGKCCGLPPMGPSICKPGLTKDVLTQFFDVNSYRGQKRPAEASSVHPAAKARMGKVELLEKFKLAAELNGFSFDEIMVACYEIKIMGRGTHTKKSGRIRISIFTSFCKRDSTYRGFHKWGYP